MKILVKSIAIWQQVFVTLYCSSYILFLKKEVFVKKLILLSLLLFISMCVHATSTEVADALTHALTRSLDLDDKTSERIRGALEVELPRDITIGHLIYGKTQEGFFKQVADTVAKIKPHYTAVHVLGRINNPDFIDSIVERVASKIRPAEGVKPAIRRGPPPAPVLKKTPIKPLPVPGIAKPAEAKKHEAIPAATARIMEELKRKQEERAKRAAQVPSR